jgi:hypothetical protein
MVILELFIAAIGYFKLIDVESRNKNLAQRSLIRLGIRRITSHPELAGRDENHASRRFFVSHAAEFVLMQPCPCQQADTADENTGEAAA